MSIERIGDVEYDFLDNNKDSLCVVFPPAGGIDSKELFVTLLSQRFNVMNIKEGYFGISRVKEEEDLENLRLGNASCSVAEKLSEMIFDNIVIIAGSVGALHALELKKILGDRKYDLVLFAPAFYKEGLLTSVHKKLLGNALGKDGFIEEGWFVKAMGIARLRKILTEMQEVSKITGERSFLLCLKEILEYSENKDGIKDLIKDALIVLGRNDYIFKALCDKDICEASRIVYIDSGHGAMKEKPKEAFELVQGFVNRQK